jgi:hypothetical protein
MSIPPVLYRHRWGLTISQNFVENNSHKPAPPSADVDGALTIDD